VEGASQANFSQLWEVDASDRAVGRRHAGAAPEAGDGRREFEVPDEQSLWKHLPRSEAAELELEEGQIVLVRPRRSEAVPTAA
jgi:hypothetical protein